MAMKDTLEMLFGVICVTLLFCVAMLSAVVFGNIALSLAVRLTGAG